MKKTLETILICILFMSCAKKEKYVDIIWNPSCKISSEEKIFTKEFLNSYSNAIVFYGVSDDRRGMCLSITEGEFNNICSNLCIKISSSNTSSNVNVYIPVANSVVVKSKEYWNHVTLVGDFMVYTNDDMRYILTIYHDTMDYPYSQNCNRKYSFFYLDYK